MTGEETFTDDTPSEAEFERREVIQAAGIASVPAWARSGESALGEGGAADLDGEPASMEANAVASTT